MEGEKVERVLVLKTSLELNFLIHSPFAKLSFWNGVKNLDTSISNCFEIFRGVYTEQSECAQYDNYNTLRKVSYSFNAGQWRGYI